jgi:hypothetical protein
MNWRKDSDNPECFTDYVSEDGRFRIEPGHSMERDYDLLEREAVGRYRYRSTHATLAAAKRAAWRLVNPDLAHQEGL